jgi:hypothetical protein
MFLLYHDFIEIAVFWNMEDSTNVSEEPAAYIFRVLLACKRRQYISLKQWCLSTTLYMYDCNLNIQ